jgi:ribosomal protein S15P/S13E
MTPDPLSLDRFTVRLENDLDNVIIADRDLTPLTGEVADRIMGDHGATVIWYTSDRHGHIVFPATDAGWSMAEALADQLNDLDAAADAEQAAALIDSAATLAEQLNDLEADAAPDLTTAQRRGLAAYQRAVEATPYQWSADCGERWAVGDRVRIGDPADPYYHGIMVALGLSHTIHGKTATVILADSPACPLIVLLDNDEPIALPSPALYVRRAE